MEVLIIIVILGLGFAFFATQNITPVAVNFVNYSFNVPVYIVVILSILIGMFFSFIISLIDNISSSFTIWGKENKIKQAREKIVKLNQHIEDLEQENIALKEKNSHSKSAIRPV